jgi:branched-chain amino acid aminotransferase
MSNSNSTPPSPSDGVDFENLPWDLNCPETVSYLHLTTSTEWTKEHYDPEVDAGKVTEVVTPYATGDLNYHPATTSLNYGVTIWEGLKCFRTTSEDKCAIFRPLKNYERFVNGCKRMSLPPPSLELFLKALQVAVQENGTMIPPVGVGMKLYLRPLMYASGQQLGLNPSSEFSYLTYVSPTGNYFKGKATALKLHLETTFSRAARGGMGSTKCAGNYGSTLLPLNRAKKAGFHDNLYMELETYDKENGADSPLLNAIIQELSAANIFVVLKSGEICTPSLNRGTILPGVTRDSVLVIAKEYADELGEAMAQSTGTSDIKVTVSERDVTVADLLEASEVFVTGTAAEIVPVASVATATELDADAFSASFNTGGEDEVSGPVTAKLLVMLREVMSEKREIKTDTGDGWLPNPYASAEDFRTQTLGGK